MPTQDSKQYVQGITDSILERVGAQEETIFPEIEIDVLSPAFTEGKKKLAPRKVGPGFFENIANHAVEHNEILAAARFAGKLLPDYAAPDISQENIPAGWSAFEEENIADLPEKYWDYVLEAQSPRDLEYRRQKSKEAIDWEERLQQGGFFSSLVGGGAGIASSPSTYFLPLAKAPKYAKFGTHLLKGVLPNAPRILAQGLIHEGIVEAGKFVSDPGEVVINGIRDAAFGIAFYGAGRALTYGGSAANVWKARKVVNVSYKGIATKVKVGEGGTYEGLVAEALPGQAVSSESLALAQSFLDNGAVLSGLSSVIGPLGRIPVFGSPLIKGLTSPFATVKKFYNRLGNQSVVTGAIERGLPRQITAEEILDGISRESRQLGFTLHDLYLEQLGLKPGAIGSAKAIVKSFKEGLTVSKASFYSNVQKAVFTGEPSLSKEVNEGAKIVTEHLNKIWKAYRDAYDLPENILPPKTAAGYLMRMYNLSELTRNPEGWVQVVVKDLSEQDALIHGYQAPINDLKSSIRTANAELRLAKGKDVKPLEAKVRKLKRQLKQELKGLHKKMQDGEIDPILLEGRPWLTNAELEELKALMKPVTQLNNRIRDSLEELPGLTRNEQKASRTRIKQMREQRANILEDLHARAANGEISANLFYKEGGAIKFHSLEPKLKFRDTYRTTQAMEDTAKGYREAILGLTPEQLNQSVFSQLSGGAITNPTKARSVMIRDVNLLEAGFLSTDLEKMVNVYSKVLGKRIALKTVFADANWNEGVSDITKDLKFEYDTRVANITENSPRTPARDKALSKLQKEFNEATDQVSNAYNYFMGNSTASPGVRTFTKSARNWTSVTMLRNVPLLQAGELGGLVFKQRLWPTITGGLVPLIRRINSRVAREEYKANASHALVGLELELGKFSNALFEGSVTEELPGVLPNLLQKSANVAQSVFLTNQIANSMQRLSANITQSRVMADLFDAAAGTLSKAGKNRLLMNGINPKEANAFIEAYKGAGGYKLNGGYVSKWYEWSDVGLQGQMQRAILNDISGSILTAGLLDKPFWMRDAALGLPFQFMGYVYAAFNKFTVPALQQPDASKALGLTMMIGYGAMVEPLRKFQKGEPFEFDSDKKLDQWFVSGLSESGALGYPVELLEMADGLLTPFFLDRYRQDKFKRRSIAGLIAGPAGGLAQSMVDSAEMFLNGKINQQGLLKFRNTIPIPINNALDAMLTRWIKSSNIPERRQDADYYSWVDRD